RVCVTGLSGVGACRRERRGRARTDRASQLVGEVTDERALEVVELLAPRRTLHVQDADHAVGYPKGDRERRSGIRVGTGEPVIADRPGKLDRLAALRDV